MDTSSSYMPWQDRQNGCSVPACENRINSDSDKKISFFRFPKDVERCLRWIILCGREDLLNKDAEFLYSKYKICAEHFSYHSFANPALKNRLVANAEPTIFSKGIYNNTSYLNTDGEAEKTVIIMNIKQEPGVAMRTPIVGIKRVTPLTVPVNLNGETESHRCYDCNIDFTNEQYLFGHLLHHIKQPTIRITPLQKAPIKLTFKTRSNNSFEILNSPTITEFTALTDSTVEGRFESETNLQEITTEDLDLFTGDHGNEIGGDGELGGPDEVHHLNGLDDVTSVMFSPNFACGTVGDSPAPSEGSYSNLSSPHMMGSSDNSNSHDNINCHDIPGAEPTPPPESPSPTTEFPKIRLKTTGLLKDHLTITEITDDDNGDYHSSEIIELSNAGSGNNQSTAHYWNTNILEDSKAPDSDNILTNFLNNTDHVSDNEFISLDRLDDRNSTALQVYNPSNSAVATLDNLTGLPMQQLAEQVSRLQPSGSHQQNVLINIQQFPQAPSQPQHNYQHQAMYPPHPGMPPAQPPPPPMYQHQPYQYQPNPMYYPPAPNYPPAPHMQPPPQMQQQSQQMAPPQQPMPPPQQPQYRPPMPPRPTGPPIRQYGPQTPNRGPVPRQPNLPPRQRPPIIRTRGGMVGSAIRGPRPRMPGYTTGNNVQNMNNNVQQRGKRPSDQMQDLQNKKKKNVFVPDINDDADCQVIAVQPKNTDGGLPQIQSVQGGTTEPSDINNIMHLSDSITLSVRNPPPKQESPKKSDAKVVANILATRGITVTATPKPKPSPSKERSQSPSVAINLNSAVSIIPTAKGNSPTHTGRQNESKLPTVDLTDDSPEPARNAATRQLLNSPQKAHPGTLPFRCDLCPAQYPTAQGLSKHRQSYHKTGSPCEIGIPLIDFKQPGIVQKLTSLGIYNFIPLPNSTPNGNFALPVVSVNAARNSSICNLTALGASSILTLGPVRSLPKPQANTNNNVPVAKH